MRFREGEHMENKPAYLQIELKMLMNHRVNINQSLWGYSPAPPSPHATA
jgi:hypothetical protein